VSTNRTIVYLVTTQPVGGAELADLRLDLALQRLKPAELLHTPGQPLKIRNDQSAHRRVTLRGSDTGIAVDVIGNRNRKIPHSFTVTRFP
jgi:hypothetical protein